ncbi:hypothetical protein KAX97_05625 [candidate division WOR-3 bacterium]|nr:hypothetical protein [candidate division WOR-3 bacterium]
MKLLKIIVKAIFILSISLIVYLQPGCKDSSEYEPPEDTLLIPPDPPQLISPINGFVIMFESVAPDTYYELKWTKVEQAEGYQMEFTTDAFPPLMVEFETNVCTIWIYDDTAGRLYDYYWRVRANSSAWEWFTEWSEQWSYETRMRPNGPQPLHPPNDTTIYVDSLPIEIDVQWDTIQDEEFYQVMIFEDSSIYDLVTVNSNSYVVFVYDTAQYSWQVRAGSSLWQYYSYWSNLWYFRVRYNN